MIESLLQFQEWMNGSSGQEAILKLLGWLFSRIVVNGVETIGRLLNVSAGESITVQLPRSVTIAEPWVVAGHALFSRVAGAGIVGVFVLALLVAATGGLLGFTTTEARSVVAVSVVVWVVNRRAMELVGSLMSFSNTLAAQFADPTELLPGWDRLSDLQRGSGEGMMLFVTGIAALFLSLVRWFTLLGVNILVVMMPLAILCAVHPATRGLFSMWWRGLLGLVLVQVPMALAIGQGQALLARYGAGAGGGALLAGVACFWLAAKMPKMIGGLAAMPGQTVAGWGRHVSNVGTFAVGGMLGAGLGGKHDGMLGAAPAPMTPHPTYRTGPLQPAPMAAVPAPRRPPPQDLMDLTVISVE